MARKIKKAQAFIKRVRNNPSGTIDFVKKTGVGVGTFVGSAFVTHQSSRLSAKVLGTKFRGDIVGLALSTIAFGAGWYFTRNSKYQVSILSGLGATVALRVLQLLTPAKTIAAVTASQEEPAVEVTPADDSYNSPFEETSFEAPFDETPLDEPEGEDLTVDESWSF